MGLSLEDGVGEEQREGSERQCLQGRPGPLPNLSIMEPIPLMVKAGDSLRILLAYQL